MPDGPYETRAGLMLARLGHIPDVGADLAVDGWRLTVVRRDRNRVAELSLVRPDAVAGGHVSRSRPLPTDDRREPVRG